MPGQINYELNWRVQQFDIKISNLKLQQLLGFSKQVPFFWGLVILKQGNWGAERLLLLKNWSLQLRLLQKWRLTSPSQRSGDWRELIFCNAQKEFLRTGVLALKTPPVESVLMKGLKLRLQLWLLPRWSYRWVENPSPLTGGGREKGDEMTKKRITDYFVNFQVKKTKQTKLNFGRNASSFS